MHRIAFLLLLVPFALLASCGNNTPTPKPKGYQRIDFPEKNYVAYDTAALPFSFERGGDAVVELKKDERRLKHVDISYPAYNGVIFLTYVRMRDVEDLAGQVDTSYQLLSKHFNYSSGVNEQQFVNEVGPVYATTYRLQGRNVASTYQFWCTDSVRHFLRGSLYINAVPNNDSLAPVLNYLQQDLDHLLETLVWK